MLQIFIVRLTISSLLYICLTFLTFCFQVARRSKCELEKWIQTVQGLPDSQFLVNPEITFDTFKLSEQDLTLENLLKHLE